MSEFEQRLRAARELSWHHFGRKIVFFLPGMFVVNGVRGKYPAISITGTKCTLMCDHCRGKLLESMLQAPTPEKLVALCLELDRKGNDGVLISGGCDPWGRLPWKRFLAAIKEIRQRTGLYISVHSGLVDDDDPAALKQAGVDQALIDVIGDDGTFNKMYHVPFGIERIRDAMASLQRAGLPMVPHIVCGLDYGVFKGEGRAVDMIADFRVEQLVIISLMGIPGTPACGAVSPEAEAVADLIARARMKMPATLISLGCARKRGDYRLETLAIDAGVNRMALPSDEAIAWARHLGLEIHFQKTCCSVTRKTFCPSWYG